MLSSKEIRQKWLDYFKKQGHLVVPTESLIPKNDPSLLWINSGVATLKDYFSGKKIPASPRLTNSQKAIRTNDIENVGLTSRHHTMFEMLGNFSIGNYFKSEAIEFAYDFLINELKMDKDKLYFTYFSEDTETKEKWLSLGIAPDHLFPGSRKTNFWDMGQGPCGPCTEIFYDRGEKFAKQGSELLRDDIENDRFIEIWNIVFSQFNNDGENNYTELVQKNIDTGAGLERIVSILQDAPTNFDTDLFLPIIKKIETLTQNYKYDVNNYFDKNNQDQKNINMHFKIIADHIRAAVNAIEDGEKPSNISRGYIIRRLIRRSYYSGIVLGIKESAFLYKLVETVKNTLPFEINVKKVQEIIKTEEELFANTIHQGKKNLFAHMEESTFISESAKIIFKMYETYGFPIELTLEILKEHNIDIDINEIEKFKQKHSEVSRGNKKAAMQKVINSLNNVTSKISEFIGYNHDNLTYDTNIIFLADTEKQVKEINGEAYLILKETPFYATSGGQKHDQGYLIQNSNKIEVLNVFKDKFGNNIHHVKGKIDANFEVKCLVDKSNRRKLEINHSSTHLLFKALREKYGANIIKQLGSDNNENRLTFDFPLDKKPTEEEILEIENTVKLYISMFVPRKYIETDLKTAKTMDAIMTLEEQEYMDENNVRLVEFRNITTDLCGGTHIYNTEKIEDFKITSVENKGTGIYRIRAITTKFLVEEYMTKKLHELIELLDKIVSKNIAMDSNYSVRISSTDSTDKQIKIIQSLIEKAREDNKRLTKKSKVVNLELENQIEIINSKQIYVNLNIDPSQLKIVAGEIREKNPEAIILLGNYSQEKTLLVIASKKYDSNILLKSIFNSYPGKGGGNSIVAQGTISTSEDIETLIKNFKGIISA